MCSLLILNCQTARLITLCASWRAEPWLMIMQCANSLCLSALLCACALRPPAAAAAGGGGKQRSAFWQGTLSFEQPGYQRTSMAEVRRHPDRGKLSVQACCAAQRTNVGAHSRQTVCRQSVLAFFHSATTGGMQQPSRLGLTRCAWHMWLAVAAGVDPAACCAGLCAAPAHL